MSRGGRGGFGRGGGGMGGVGGMFGGDDLKPDYSVTELFPPQPPPVQTSLTKQERAIIARFRNHREKIHNGPMYTVMARKRGMEDPFNDISRYSQKYKKVSRKAPKLDARPYVHKFFPRELYPTLGIEDANSKATNGKSRVVTVEKRLLFSGLDALNPLDDILEGGSDAEDENGAGVGEDGVAKKTGGVTAMLNDADDDADDADDDDEEPDDFTDDDEGDYNAEQYFDDGDDIGDDFGDDDGGDFF